MPSNQIKKTSGVQSLTATELKRLLYTNIPLTKSTGVEVIQAEMTCAMLSAPVQYERPVCGEMLAQCKFDDELRWSRFMRTLERHGRAKISLDAIVLHDGQRCASFKGDFVALCR